MKQHVFLLTVEGASTKKQAEMAVLSAFAKRNPDGCKFHLKTDRDYKKAWIDGSYCGVKIGLDLVQESINKLRRFATK